MISLDGNRLTFDELVRVTQRSEPVQIHPSALPAMLHSRAVVEKLASGNAPVYAVNTGVGLLADVRVPPEQLEQLQRNVVRSHACGVGAPLASDEVRSARERAPTPQPRDYRWYNGRSHWYNGRSHDFSRRLPSHLR